MPAMSSARTLPSVVRKFVVSKLTQKFREAVQLVTVPCPSPGPSQIMIKNRFLGINASDINFTAARYDPSVQPPFDCGFEGIGEVVAIGKDCMQLKVGQSVGYTQNGAFCEYIIINEKNAMPLPGCKSDYLPLLVSGLTAAISLDRVGIIRAKETVLVTAAAGGTGQFAVQWARNAGCHVIGTCSSDDKMEFLHKIGCHRPINYLKEDLKTVLKSEYPDGVNVVYESVGGKTFETCLDSLAIGGRLLAIGFISGYESSSGVTPLKTQTHALVAKLLTRSASLRGFFLFHYANDFAEYINKLIQLKEDGKLISSVDNGTLSSVGPFRKLESIPDAMDYLYSRKSIGKIVVELTDDEISKL